MGGQLIIFEGPDGVGKTTLSQRVVNWLEIAGLKARYISFPGREPGSLGNLIYEIHHDSNKLGVTHVQPTALQLLHVSAHIDALHKTIGPALKAGENIVLDRYWWSTVVYGRTTAVDENSILLMIELEKLHWAGFKPSVVFLLDRPTPGRVEQTPEAYKRLQSAYAELARSEGASYKVRRSPPLALPMNHWPRSSRFCATFPGRQGQSTCIRSVRKPFRYL